VSENLFYYLSKHGITDQEIQKKAAQATAEWLESRKQWSIFREEKTVNLLLAETAFKKGKTQS
jgi:hypothetical protein